MASGSPTKNTGGGGFVVENRVVAYYLASMLAVAPIEAELGELASVAAQQGSAGWAGGLDDIVLTFEQDSVQAQLALSVKSYSPFSSRSAPHEFVTAAWRHLLGLDVRQLAHNDLLGMGVGPTPSAVRAALTVLTDAARNATAADLEVRIATPGAASEVARNLYASLACPAQLAEGRSAHETSPWHLLRRLRVVYFDFEATPSLSLEAALTRCRTALESGEMDKAQALWEMLLRIGDDLRPSGGSMSRADLVTRVADRHSLREKPSYRADIKRLQRIGRDERERVRDAIGNVRLERRPERARVHEALAGSSTVALVGSAGTGKSALAKLVAEDASERTLVVWLSAHRLEAPSMAELSEVLGLTHALDELLLDQPQQTKILVVDGLDRGSASARLGTLTLLSRRLLGANAGWQILMTSRAEEWRRLESELVAAGYPLDSLTRVDLEEPSLSELEPVWAAYPTLRLLSLRPQLRTLLLKPKVLDLMARHESARPDVTGWTGESDLIEWFWQEEVDSGDHGLVRSEALKRLASRQADELEAETPLSAIDTTALDELRHDELVRVRNERVSFAHDLYGDWARERVILGNRDEFIAWVSPKLASPPWHRAARLYALSLIEQGKVDEWRTLLAEAAQSDPVLTDIIVESAIFAADAASVLELIWAELAADEGRLLRRLLRRLLFIATLPNPTILAWASQRAGVLPSEAATLNRIPFPPYWPPVLRFLASHAEEVVNLALIPLAEVCDTWLRRGDPRLPQRQEAAQLALAAAEKLYAERRNGVWITGGIDEKIYRAALAGGLELPQQVGDLSLRLVRRRDVDGAPRRETEWGGVSRELPPPWPLGPSERIDESVQKLMLSPDGLVPVFHGAPALGREALVATLIKPPQIRDLGEIGFPGEELGLEGRLDWHPPTWYRGPFISLLREAPEEGVAAILGLADFATSRWASVANNDASPTLTVPLASADRVVSGDAEVFAWYRGVPSAPEALVVALMALERFVYEQIDAEEPVEQLLERILAETNSAAVLGVLVAVACYQPSLLAGPLQPLLATPELLVWDRRQKWSDRLQGSTALQISLLNEDEQLRQTAIDWQTMPHRQTALEDVALPMMFDGSADDFFDEFRRRLNANEEELRERGPAFERLLTVFDRERYVAVRDEQGQIWLTIPQTPEQIAETEEANSETARSMAILEFVPRCRRILDGDLQLTEEEVPEFWQALRDREQAPPPSEFEPGFLSNEDALCGGICVLLAFHRDWVAEDEARERWCREILMRSLASPPPRDQMTGDSHDDGTWAWDRFAAQALAILLADDPSSQDLRFATARLACFYRYSTVATLFRTLAERRADLRETFVDLRNLSLWWATARPKFRNEDAHDEVMAELAAAVEDFAAGGHPPEAQWDELIEVEELESQVTHRRRKRNRPVADLSQIQSVYLWLPELDRARDEAERAEWIAFWRRALAFELGILGAPAADDDGPDIAGTPYQWDRWLLNQLAGMTLDMRDEEDPESFWRPILELGSPARLWVESFLQGWFLYGFAEKPAPAKFVSRWRSMIEYALASPKWKTGSGRFYQEELWITLLALEWTLESAWSAEQTPALLAAKDLYERWSQEALTSRWSAEKFARFLWRTGAGDAIQLDGIVWLGRAAATRFWAERDVQDELARLLGASWQNKRAGLGSATAPGQAFRRLLRLLAEAQNELALALLDEIGAW